MSLFIDAMKLRNGEEIVRLAPIDGKYFHAHIIDNVLAFSSYRYKHVDTYLHSIFDNHIMFGKNMFLQGLYPFQDNVSFQNCLHNDSQFQ